MIVLGGSEGAHVGFELSKLIGARYHDVEVKEFPDGELYVRIPVDLSGLDVVYVNSLAKRPNELLVETVLTLETIADVGARTIHAVLTYIPYARQDTRFKPGEAVSALVIAKHLKSLRIDRLYTFDLHLHRFRDPRHLFGDNFVNLTAVRDLVRYISASHKLRNCVIVGPDEESEQWAKVASEELGGLPYTVMEKKRISASEVVVEPRNPDIVAGRSAIVVDDIISTGGTIVETVRVLRNLGVREVYVAVTHAILAGRALSKLTQLELEDLVASDTVLSPISKVRTAPIIARSFLNPISP
ncbi:MAG: ribose-phosphate diphosphokinase [Sulfolobales archaeon]